MRNYNQSAAGGNRAGQTIMRMRTNVRGGAALRSRCLLAAFLTVGAGSLVTSAAHAQEITALESVRGVGNQDFTGSLGMDFNVNAGGITVTSLGAFDSGQDGFVNSISVGIFDRNTQTLLFSTELTTATSVLQGQSRFSDIGRFFLGEGQYSIVAQGFSGADLNGNVTFGGPAPTINTGGGSIAFVGTARYDAARTPALVFPGTADSGPANQYDAGTFEFLSGQLAPEPGTFALLSLGLFPVAAMVARRRRAKR